MGPFNTFRDFFSYNGQGIFFKALDLVTISLGIIYLSFLILVSRRPVVILEWQEKKDGKLNRAVVAEWVSVSVNH